MLRFMKMSLFVLLFAGLGLFNMGGCGGSSGDGGGGGGGANCLLPALDTNFSNDLYIFFDPFTLLTIGVTSDGETVVIAIVDFEGAAVGAVATPISAFACVIFGGIVGEALFDADGLCARSDDAELFAIFDFSILGILFVEEAIGECETVEPLVINVSVAEATQSVVLEMQSRSELGYADAEGIIFGDILEELNSKQGN